MNATIRKIHPGKASYSGGNIFIRVEFMLDDGKWAKTDLCPSYRNYARWEGIINAGVGTEITGFRFKRPGEIDGDSFPRIVKMPTEESIAKLENPKKREGSNGEQQKLL